jgi:hypothetical protein
VGIINKREKLSLVLSKALRHEVWRGWCIASRIFNLSTKWRWVVSFTLWHQVSRSNGYHSCYVFGWPRVQISVRRPAVLSGVLRGVPESLQANSIENWATTSSFTILSNLSITLRPVIRRECELLNTSINDPQIKNYAPDGLFLVPIRQELGGPQSLSGRSRHLSCTWCCNRFLFSWSLGENQSEEHYATWWGVWGGPTVFVCFLAGFGRVTCSRAELISVAKCILQPREGGSGQTRSGWTVKRDNTELLTIQTSRIVAKLQLKAGPTPLFFDLQFYVPANVKLLRKGMDYYMMWIGRARNLQWVLRTIPLSSSQFWTFDGL